MIDGRRNHTHEKADVLQVIRRLMMSGFLILSCAYMLESQRVWPMAGFCAASEDRHENSCACLFGLLIFLRLCLLTDVDQRRLAT